MTEKLYYEDSHRTEFDAVVLTCEAADGGFWVTLDRTAFYPTGGGQDADTGTLGGAAVSDVAESDGQIRHFCDRPLAVGASVHGCVDWATRFFRMQQHSGEHIVSGLIHQYHGYDNVGFHMGKDCMTLDFSGPLSDEDLRRVERDANEIVAKNLPVKTSFHESGTLKEVAYRSKKALEGTVRLVEIPHADLCACCGTHVDFTGEIGLILFLGREKFKGGTRVELVCGSAAVERAFCHGDQCRDAGALLSVKPDEVVDGVRRILQESGEQKLKIAQLSRQWLLATAEKYRSHGDVVLFFQPMENSLLGKLAAAVADVCGGYCTAAYPSENGFFFAMSHREKDVRPLCKELLARFGGRGGGKPALAQGTVAAAKAELTAYLEEAYQA